METSTCRNFSSSRLICEFGYDVSRIQLFFIGNVQRHIQPSEVTQSIDIVSLNKV